MVPDVIVLDNDNSKCIGRAQEAARKGGLYVDYTWT